LSTSVEPKNSGLPDAVGRYDVPRDRRKVSPAARELRADSASLVNKHSGRLWSAADSYSMVGSQKGTSLPISG